MGVEFQVKTLPLLKVGQIRAFLSVAFISSVLGWGKAKIRLRSKNLKFFPLR